MVAQSAMQRNTLPQETETVPHVRCCGCFNWTPDYQVDLTADGLGYALCRLCQIRSKSFRWRKEQIDRNVAAYTGGDMGEY